MAGFVGLGPWPHRLDRLAVGHTRQIGGLGQLCFVEICRRRAEPFLAPEGFALGIHSTVICPGFVATDMAKSLTAMDPNQMTQPEDITRMIAMLLDLPNEAVVSELAVNCTLEPSF